MDHLPYIGRSNPFAQHVYVATSFSKWGMSNGSASGLILADLITGQENPWAKIFDSNRATLAGVKTLIEQNLHVAKDYVTGYLPASSDEVVPVGEGKVVEGEEGKVALYHANDGRLHRLSAVCTHMGCIVGWNSAEKSWDCPCHGSRFSPTGQVINGPAIKPLAPMADDSAPAVSG